MAVEKYYLSYSSATCWQNKKTGRKSLSASGSSSASTSSNAELQAEANARNAYNSLSISTSIIGSGYASSSSTYTDSYRIGVGYGTSRTTPNVTSSVSGPFYNTDGTRYYTGSATASGTGYATRTVYAVLLKFTTSDLIQTLPSDKINSATITLKGSSSSTLSDTRSFYAAVCNTVNTTPTTMITNLDNYTKVSFSLPKESGSFSVDISIGTLVKKMIETGNYYIYLFPTSTSRGYYTLSLTGSNAPNINYNWGNSYTLSYNMNGGVGSIESSTKSGLENASFTVSTTVPTLENYQFLGWDSNSAATSATYHSGDSITINANTVLYAVWTGASLTITFDARGGTVTPASQGASYESPYGNLPIPECSPYKFIAWATKPQTGRITSSTIITNPDNHTLYAQWYLPKVRWYEGITEKQIYIKE